MATNTTRWVLIDDSYPSIQYRGPWYQSHDSLADSGVSGPIYQGSQRGVHGTASLNFTFSGTNIRVLGTSAVTLSVPTNEVDPKWACIVDGKVIAVNAPTQQPTNQYPLCVSTPLSDGPHNLTVVISSSGTPFWFDFLMVAPSPSSNAIEHPAVMYMFSDPAVQYASGQWTTLPDSAGMLTQQAGSTVFLSFNGTKVTWYGRMISGYPSGPSTGTYAIDGGAPISFTIDGLLFDWTTRYQQIIFETEDLPMGKHDITVKYLGSSTPLVLEYMVIQDGDLVFTGGNGAPPVIDDHHSKPLSTGVIVGAVLGGIALLAMLAVICLLLRKLKQRRRVKRLKEIDEGSPYIPSAMPPQYIVEATPFVTTARDDLSPPVSLATTPSPSATATFADGVSSRPLSQVSTLAAMPRHQSMSSYTSDEKVRSKYLDAASSASPSTSRRASSTLYNPPVAMQHTSMPSTSDIGPPVATIVDHWPESSGFGTPGRPLALVNAEPEAQAGVVTLVHHEDSGLRLASDPLGVPTVLDVPPSYTPQ